MSLSSTNFLTVTQPPSHWSLIPYPLSLTVPYEPYSTRNP
jgi:hypothetical protein